MDLEWINLSSTAHILYMYYRSQNTYKKQQKFWISFSITYSLIIQSIFFQNKQTDPIETNEEFGFNTISLTHPIVTEMN